MVKNKLPDRLREIRETHSHSQEAFGKIMGVTSTTINRYENGKRIPDADFLSQLVVKFNCDTTWLLTGEWSKSGLLSRPNGLIQDKEAAEIMEWLEENPNAQKFLVKLVRASREIDAAVEGLKLMAHKGLKISK